MAPAELLNAVVGFLRRYLVITAAQADALALGIAHTHCWETSDYCPIFHVTAPVKQCGKSRLLDVVTLLAGRPWQTGRTTTANLVARCARGCTLLLDETDAAFERGGEYAAALRGILDCRFERGRPASLMVPGKEGGWESRDFDIYGPSFIAGIGKLPDTAQSRSVPIALRRKLRSESVQRFRRVTAGPKAAPLREGLKAWGAELLTGPHHAAPALPEALSDRQQDICEPLLAIADAAGGDWPERALRALVELCTGHAAVDESAPVKLLAACCSSFAAADRLSSEQLAAAVGDALGGPLTPIALARRLDPFEITPRNVKFSDGRVLRGYHREQFADAWARYLPPLPLEGYANRYPATSRINIGPNGNFEPLPGIGGSTPENAVSANKDGPGSGVAPCSPEPEGAALEAAILAALPAAAGSGLSFDRVACAANILPLRLGTGRVRRTLRKLERAGLVCRTRSAVPRFYKPPLRLQPLSEIPAAAGWRRQ